MVGRWMANGLGVWNGTTFLFWLGATLEYRIPQYFFPKQSPAENPGSGHWSHCSMLLLRAPCRSSWKQWNELRI